jgi:hypothetical protein
MVVFWLQSNSKRESLRPSSVRRSRLMSNRLELKRKRELKRNGSRLIVKTTMRNSVYSLYNIITTIVKIV